VISDRLREIARCPQCRGRLDDGSAGELRCPACGRTRAADGGYLDLRPDTAFDEQTKYLDHALHADARHETVSPPLLTAGVKHWMLRTLLDVGPEDRVLDLGCGSGRVLVWDRGRAGHAVGIDVSPYFAAEALEHVDLALGDLRQLPFDADTFTTAYALDVFEHMSRPALEAVLREAGRVLAPGGRLFAYSHVRRNSRLALGLRWINALGAWLDRRGVIDTAQERLRKSDHVNPLATIDELRAVGAQAGFRLARIRYYTPLLGAFVENIVMRIAERLLTGRVARRLPARASAGGPEGDAARRTTRAAAKQRIAARGPTYLALQALTWLIRLDVLLFGRVRSGPYFALFVKDGDPPPNPGA